MCGIFGCLFRNEISLGKLRAARDTLYHRGPDQAGETSGIDFYHGHRRLSINDLSGAGKQPFLSRDSAVSVCVNGEIYNWTALKTELEDDYQFKSHCDCEVVLAGYLLLGIEALLKRLEGMFAFSIIDVKRRKCFLARDRVGIKPLYYSDTHGMISWASELKAIVNLHDLDTSHLDKTAIYDFLNYGYIPAPKTMYVNVKKLEPAHYIEMDMDTFERQTISYWTLKNKNICVPQQEAITKIDNLIRNSLHSQSATDVGYGFFLSGGIDSSAIASLSPKSDNKKAYCIKIDDPNKDESYFAQLVADNNAISLVKTDFSEEDLLFIKDKFPLWFDEPFADTSAFPTYFVSKLAKEHGEKVVLTGDGGDEILGGYTRYLIFNKLNHGYKLPPFLLRFIQKFTAQDNILGKASRYIELSFGLQNTELYLRLMGGLTFPEKNYWRKRLGIHNGYDEQWLFKKYYHAQLSPIKRLMFLDFHTYLPEDILTKVDRVSMANSLECRVPLLDTSLIEYCFSLDEKLLVPNRRLKSLLKDVIIEFVPMDIIKKRKQGFSIPAQKWLNLSGSSRSKWVGILERYWKNSINNVKNNAN